MISRDALADLVVRHELTLIGVTNDLQIEEAARRYRAWLSNRYQADMDYMTANQTVRENPTLIMDDVRSCLVFCLVYGGEAQTTNRNRAKGRTEDRATKSRVAKYARFQDYHKIMWRRGNALLVELQASIAGFAGRVVVDTAPVLERALASKLAPMFVGKNTMAIHATKGSFLMLGELFGNMPLPASEPTTIVPQVRDPLHGGCGSCKRCQVHCPTNALQKEYTLDANLCLSYWTIEHRGTIPKRFWPHLAKYWYGCDICQDVCPYNRQTTRDEAELGKKLPFLDLFQVATMTLTDYQRTFGGFPMVRAKREGLMRNALIALYVTKDARLNEAIRLVSAIDDLPVLRQTAQEILCDTRITCDKSPNSLQL